MIDDDADFRETLRRQLEALGTRVVVAADGLDGLQQLERWHPDAVLCDLAMPMMDGLEFARGMRSDPRFRHVLLMAVTGRADQADVVDTWRAGFDGHLVKPVTAEMLESFVQRVTALPVRLDRRA